MTTESPALRYVPAPDNLAPLATAHGNGDAFVGRMRWLERVVSGGAWAKLTGASRSVLVILLVHANVERGMECWPSLSRIGEQAGLSRSAVKKALLALIEAKLITRLDEGGGRTSTHYRLVRSGWESLDHHATDAGWESPANGTHTTHRPDGAGGHPSDRVTPVTRRGSLHEPPGGHPSDLQGVTPVTPNGGIEQRNDVVVDAVTLPAEIRAADRPEPAAGDGLFDELAAAALLEQRGFDARDARRLVADHGIQNVRQGVAHADLLEREGELRKGYRPACVHAIKAGYADARVLEDKRKAEQREQAKAARERREAEQAQRARHEAEQLAAAETRLAALSPDQVDALRARVLEDKPDSSRALLGEKFIRGLMLKHLTPSPGDQP